jgi:hypothetical protein
MPALGLDQQFSEAELRALTAGWRFREVSKQATEVSFVAPAGAPADAAQFWRLYKFTSPSTQRTRIVDFTIPLIKLQSGPAVQLPNSIKLIFARGQQSGKTMITEELFTSEYAPWQSLSLSEQRNRNLNSSLHLEYDSGAQEVTLAPDETFEIWLTNTTILISIADSDITLGMYFQDMV